MPAVNLISVSAVYLMALFVIYKKIEYFDTKLIGLIIVMLVLCSSLQAFMFKDIDVAIIEKIFLTALGFGGGIFAANQSRSDPRSRPPRKNNEK